MKVLYLCADLGIPLNGHKGASAHVRGFVAALKRLGHQVRVLSPAGDRTQPDNDIIDSSGLFLDDADDVPKRMRRALRHISSNLPVEQALEKVCQEFQPDLIYERYSPFAIAGGLVAKRLSIRHILEVNAPLSREGATFRSQALPEVAASLEQQAFHAAGEIVVVSSELRDELQEIGICNSKLHVLPNGVEVARFATPELPQGQELSDDNFVVGFVGSLKPWHDIAGMLEVFQSLIDDEKYHFLVVGDGPEGKRVREFAENNPGRVSLSGAIDHACVPGQLARLHVALAPYPVMEKFYFSPLKILEYMAAGRAIVASRIGQVGQLIRHRETGLLTEPGDILGMAEAIRELCDDPELRQNIGQNAASEALERHDWTHRVAEVSDLARTMKLGSA